eukprot:TRINITY_DN49476_c0_g1_i1.p1 TRINITY_DN49476_c0_g1~~TRINITY_DN49476_c0_g1_i1.p1  ORF type:complete len:510 (+),score=45.57 TRINITY_DN49476_c0_g1_i1:50-1579(+)
MDQKRYARGAMLRMKSDLRHRGIDLQQQISKFELRSMVPEMSDEEANALFNAAETSCDCKLSLDTLIDFIWGCGFKRNLQDLKAICEEASATHFLTGLDDTVLDEFVAITKCLLDTFNAEKQRRSHARSAESAKRVMVRCDSSSGHAIGKLIMSGVEGVLVSTPELGLPESGVPPYDFPAMDVAERLMNFMNSAFVASYDFKGSASQQDCATRAPDKDLLDSDWNDLDRIESTQWCRYWSGRVRSTMATMLLKAKPLDQDISYETVDGEHYAISRKVRMIFAFSVAGGPITQTERKLLPGLISGCVADLSTRQLQMGGLKVWWIHFKSMSELVRALQGYGGFDFLAAARRQGFGLPAEWQDGPYNEKYDVLQKLPGNSPEERRNSLYKRWEPTPGEINDRLVMAVQALSVTRVQELLAMRANPSHISRVGHSVLMSAVSKAQPDIVQALLENKADPHYVCQTDCGHPKCTALQNLETMIEVKKWPEDLPGAFERVERTRRLLVEAGAKA